MEACPITFLDCPAYLDHNSGVRCGLPAEIRCRFVMNSTDGPLESVMTRCPSGHLFSSPIEFLIIENQESRPTSGMTANRPPSRSG